MLDQEEARWISSTANELNNLLQVIAESSGALEGYCQSQPGVEKYLTMLHSGLERATQVTRTLAERAGGFPPEQAAVSEQADATAKPAEATASPDAPFTIHNPEGKKELVMVVDDEEFITELATIVLTEEGYRVVTAQDGLQALSIYRRLKDEISLVILDFTMPVMDGSDVFANCRRSIPRSRWF